MLFENLRVRRVVVHEVFQRSADRTARAPAVGDALEALSAEAMGAFQLRLTDALAAQNQSLQMRIVKHDRGSFLDVASTLMSSTDREFPGTSQALAEKLTDAQDARRIPGGMLVVFDGTVGAPAAPFVGVIKAETQPGFRRSQAAERTIIEFLQDVFLTPATRLYKVGMMVRHDADATRPEGWEAFVFDSNISASNREAAAGYFYGRFLGCALPSSGPYETAKFFDLTKEFVRRSALEPEAKRDAIDGLYSFVREQEPTFTAGAFAERHLPPEVRDPYDAYMRSKQFTPNAVVRDVSQMGTRLRRRRLKFGADVELSASPDVLASKVQIRPIPGDEVDGRPQQWTEIIVHAPLTGEQ